MKNIEDIAAMLKEGNKLKKEMFKHEKSETNTGIIRKLYAVSEENKKLKMENMKLKVEINAAYATTG